MSTFQENSVSELLQRIRGGDREARKQLFSLLGDESEFGSVMLAMARRLLPKNHRARRFVDTRDIVQSALRTGLRHFSDFEGETAGEIYNWFRMIIRTKVSRAGRNRDPGVPHPEPEEQEDREARLPISVLVDEEFIRILHTAIQKLPIDQRVVVELRLRGANSNEIGELLGLNPATVRKRESRAVERLRALVA